MRERRYATSRGGIMSDIQSVRAQSFAPVDYATWRAEAERSLKGASFEKRLVSKTLDGFEVQPLYTEAPDNSGFPGLAPFTRGATPIPAEEGWEIRQEFAHPDFKVTNAQILRDLDRGVSGVSLIFDAGFARGTHDASSVGIPARTVADLQSTLDGVWTSMVGVSTNAGLNGHGALALLAAFVDAAGQQRSDVRGALGYDPIAQLLDDGALPVSAARAFDLGADLACWTRANAPNLRPITISGRSIQEAGASEAQEIGWALALGILWMRELTQRGLSANDAADSIAFNLSAGRDIFLEVAKLRAARRVWARALEAIGVDSDHRAMELNVRGSSATISKRDPWVNMLRVTGHTFSGAFGGAQSITTPSFDDAIAPPAEFGRRIARNTQLILRDESHLARVADPAGGSYYLETMTSKYSELAWGIMQEIEANGGALAFATSGALHEKVGAVRTQREKDIANRRLALTGVSEFPNLTEKPVDTPQPAPVAPAAVAEKASATAAAIAAGSFNGAVTDAAIRDAKAGVSATGVLAVLLDGAELTAPTLAPVSYHGPWEALRDAADGYAAKNGGYPQIFLACVGRIPEHRARATFAQNLFAAGGMNAPMNDGYPGVDEAVQAFKESGADVACICSSDARYEEVATPLAKALRDAGARQVILAGRNDEKKDEWTSAGVNTFIYMGCDALGTVRTTLEGFGVNVEK